ncbi:MAG: hypothetical protein ACI861_001212 [Paracoccaceae bacterium]|jgi:hypothetical protein
MGPVECVIGAGAGVGVLVLFRAAMAAMPRNNNSASSSVIAAAGAVVMADNAIAPESTVAVAFAENVVFIVLSLVGLWAVWSKAGPVGSLRQRSFSVFVLPMNRHWLKTGMLGKIKGMICDSIGLNILTTTSYGLW